MWENGASRFATLLPYDWYYPVLDRLLVLPLSVLNVLGGFDGVRSDSTIEFRHERGHYFDFTFCAVPMSAWETFVPAYVRFCHDFRRETGFRVTLLSEVYVMSRDNELPRIFQKLNSFGAPWIVASVVWHESHQSTLPVPR